MHIADKNLSIKPMKATDYNKVADKWKPTPSNCIIEQKFDGARCMIKWFAKEKFVELYSGNGHLFRFEQLKKVIESFELSEDYTFDGELCYGQGKSEDRSSISGRLNRALHGDDINGKYHENVVFHCFDLISNEPQTLAGRRSKLEIIGEQLKDNPVYGIYGSCFEIVPTLSFSTISVEDAVQFAFKCEIDAGNEGIMIKNLLSFYEPGKRSKYWLKLKAENTADLKCVGVEPGTGKYTGMIGALLLEGEGRTVKVGSGLVDAERAMDPQNFIGKTIEIKYNCLTDDSFFLPIFKRIRLDK